MYVFIVPSFTSFSILYTLFFPFFSRVQDPFLASNGNHIHTIWSIQKKRQRRTYYIVLWLTINSVCVWCLALNCHYNTCIRSSQPPFFSFLFVYHFPIFRLYTEKDALFTHIFFFVWMNQKSFCLELCTVSQSLSCIVSLFAGQKRNLE